MDPADNLPDVPDSFETEITSAEFEAAHGEPLARVLNLETWTPGEDLLSAYGRLEQEVAEALARESEYHKTIRTEVFHRIRNSPYAPPGAGVYRADLASLERIHTGLLFNGGVEAADGISTVHDTIPLTITQIGVCLVSYNGQQGSWAHRLFRRDLRERMADPIEELRAVFEKREKRDAINNDRVSDLTRRGIMAYAERALLKDKSAAAWRMGHGNLAAYELLTGFWANKTKNLQRVLELIEWYVSYKRFVFLPSEPGERHWLMIGNALEPSEFAIVQTLQPYIENMLDRGHYRQTRTILEEFCHDAAPKIVVGLYRVWEGSPPHLFYAHKDYADVAAHIAMADSLLQEHRGFPMLIDLADTVCKTTFGVETFMPSVQMAYTEAGQPFRYLGERETRYS